MFDHAPTLKYGQCQWKWYEQVKLNEQYLQNIKLDIYYTCIISEKSRHEIFVPSRLVSWMAQHWPMCFVTWQKCWFFDGHCLREVFQNLCGYYLAGGLAIPTRFNDLISRSQVCQNHKLQTGFRFLSTVVYWCMVATDIKKYALCECCVFMRCNYHDFFAIYTWRRVVWASALLLVILHLNASQLSICSSCF